MKRRLEPVAAPLFRGAYVRRTRRKSQRPTVTVRVSTRRVATAGLMSPRSSRGAAPRVCRTHAAFSGGYLSSSVSRFGGARPRWFKAVRRDAPPCLARPRPPESGVPHFFLCLSHRQKQFLSICPVSRSFIRRRECVRETFTYNFERWITRLVRR